MRYVATFVLFAIGCGAAEMVPVRSRAQLFKGSDEWQEVRSQYALDPQKTAIIICDMWDKHWCSGATDRVNKMVAKMDAVLQAARRKGILVVHAPSDTMDFYKDDPRRQLMKELERVTPATVREISAPPLPIDDSAGGCDTGEKMYKAWKRQHPGLSIGPQDVISDKGEEIYSALKLRGRTDVLIMGVHTNMCILNRSFAIKQMSKWGVKPVLVRDLTDAMYDPKAKPFVSHEEGTELVIQHIEKYWCPTVLSRDIMTSLSR
jgi:nicotinamidase-related amidase